MLQVSGLVFDPGGTIPGFRQCIARYGATAGYFAGADLMSSCTRPRPRTIMVVLIVSSLYCGNTLPNNLESGLS